MRFASTNLAIAVACLKEIEKFYSNGGHEGAARVLSAMALLSDISRAVVAGPASDQKAILAAKLIEDLANQLTRS